MRRINNEHDELKMQKYVFLKKWLNSMKLMLNLPPEGNQEPRAVACVGVRLWLSLPRHNLDCDQMLNK